MRSDSRLGSHVVSNDYRFSGRVALVTGGASGIGAAVVRRLAAEGANVASFDLQAAPADGVVALAGDVSRSAEVDVAVRRVQDELGPIDVLVCAAGVPGESLPSLDIPDEEWRRVLAINADGVFFCNRAVARSMIERSPMGRMGAAEEVAALICWLASEECSFSTGATYDISGGRAVY